MGFSRVSQITKLLNNRGLDTLRRIPRKGVRGGCVNVFLREGKGTAHKERGGIILRLGDRPRKLGASAEARCAVGPRELGELKLRLAFS